jgi:hypothetical protein
MVMVEKYYFSASLHCVELLNRSDGIVEHSG